MKHVLICDCIREGGKPGISCPGYAKCSEALADVEAAKEAMKGPTISLEQLKSELGLDG